MDYVRMLNGSAGIAIVLVATGLLSACRPGPKVMGLAASPERIKDAIDQPNAPLTLVHVWATWCDPCREEFPDVLKVYRDTRGEGLALLLVSADDPQDMETVDRFLHEQDSPVGSLVSTELSQSFVELFSTNWSGALPASFFFDPQGTLLAEWQGKHSYAEYHETIERLLKP